MFKFIRLSSSMLLTGAALGLAILTGCTASVPMYESDISNQSKEFAAPSDNKAGIYVYRRDGYIAQAVKKDVYIDGVCLGETAPGVFFYTEVEGDKTHTIATESEFSANQISLFTKPGQNYFIEQYMRVGFFVGQSDLRQVTEEEGKKQVRACQQAIPGTCKQAYQ